MTYSSSLSYEALNHWVRTPPRAKMAAERPVTRTLLQSAKASQCSIRHIQNNYR